MLLAADVTAQILGGSLFITGSDSQAKHVSIHVDTQDSTKFDVDGSSGTTINGAATQQFSISQLTGSLIASLNGETTLSATGATGFVLNGGAFVTLYGTGNNVVTLTNLNCQGPMIITALGGNDTYNLTGLTVASTTSIYDGGATNKLALTQDTFNGPFLFAAIGGNNTTTIQQSTFASLFVETNVGGQNAVNIDDSTFNGVFVENLGGTGNSTNVEQNPALTGTTNFNMPAVFVDFGGPPPASGGTVNIGTPSTKATFSSVSVFIGATVNASATGAVFSPYSPILVDSKLTTGSSASTPTLNPTSLPDGKAGVAYSQTITTVANTGTGASTLALTNLANTVAGLTVTGSGTGTITIAGTPTSAGTVGFDVNATDSDGATSGIKHYAFTVSPASNVSLATVTPVDLAAGRTEYIPLTAVDSAQNPVSFNVQSSNPSVSAQVLTGGRTIKMNVSGVDSSNVAFTGDLTFRLFEGLAPNTTARIISLVNSGFYNNLTFHRVINGFVAQGGDPLGNGTGGSGVKFNDEFNTALTFNSNGLLAMANSGPDTNDSQFFITDTGLPLNQLYASGDFKYTIFGVLTSGFDTFKKLITTPTDSNSKPLTKETINSAQVINDTQNGVLQVTAPASFTGNANITVNATNATGSASQQMFGLNVVADTVTSPPFLGPVTNQTTTAGTPVTFNVQGIDVKTTPLTFVVKDPSTFSDTNTTALPQNVTASIVVTPANGTTPATAAITLTPAANFTGTINLLIGVRDQVNRAASPTTIDGRSNFDTQQITLTVT